MIKFENVTFKYSGSNFPILENVNLTIPAGELALVVGKTGSGKSTLLGLINGLVPSFTGGDLTGDVTVNGRSIKDFPPRDFADLVGVVRQDPRASFVTDLVEDELAYGMEQLGISQSTMRRRVEEVLDLLGLAELRNRSLATLSGGQRQRVAIASVLTTNPKVLVLDEPTSALDPIAAEEVLSILHRLVHDLGLTVVIAEHKLERVIQFADRIVYINGEGVANVGTPEEILMQSPIAPPIVHLAKALGLKEIGVTVREMRRMTTQYRDIETTSTVETPPTTSKVITFEKLTVSYGDTNALNSITSEIFAGEVVAVMGRNGAGKSSLLKALAGVNQPTGGSISLLGKNPFELHGKQRRETIGFIPQEPSDLLYGQSVAIECEQADRDNELTAGTTYAVLQQLVPGISTATHPRDLSEGQRLGLALSVVLSSNPSILILDEPTRGLDYQAKNELTRMLINFSASFGKAVILATHDVELVAELASRVIFIADGDIVADGSTLDVLLSSPAFAPQVAKVMSPQPWLSVKDVVAALEGLQ